MYRFFTKDNSIGCISYLNTHYVYSGYYILLYVIEMVFNCSNIHVIFDYVPVADIVGSTFSLV